ncbi:MAG: hypothetical protein AAGL98_12415, partial [Planctomycetota bacterium]
MAACVAVAVMSTGVSPAVGQDAEPAEPPQRVTPRDAQDLLRGEWSGTTVNAQGRSRNASLTLDRGDFSAATGRFNNWKILRGRAQSKRGAAVTITLFAPGTTDGQPVEKPIRLVGRFDDDLSRWVGEFRGFAQSGQFELNRKPQKPAADAVRGVWSGHLVRSRARNGETPAPFGFNLLTGDFVQATGVVFLADDHPPADSIELTYFNPATREID